MTNSRWSRCRSWLGCQMAAVLVAGGVGACNDSYPTAEPPLWSDILADTAHGDAWADVDDPFDWSVHSGCDLGPVAGCCDHHVECPLGWPCADGACAECLDGGPCPTMESMNEGDLRAHIRTDLIHGAPGQVIVDLTETSDEAPETHSGGAVSLEAPRRGRPETETHPGPGQRPPVTVNKEASPREAGGSADPWLHSASRVAGEDGEVFHVVCSYPGLPGLYYGDDCADGVLKTW